MTIAARTLFTAAGRFEGSPGRPTGAGCSSAHPRRANGSPSARAERRSSPARRPRSGAASLVLRDQRRVRTRRADGGLSPPGRGSARRDHGWSDGSVVSPPSLCSPQCRWRWQSAPPSQPPRDSVLDAIDVNWTRDGAPIAGADGRQDTIAEQEIGDRLRGVETAFERTAKATATSAAVIPKRWPRRRAGPRLAVGVARSRRPAASDGRARRSRPGRPGRLRAAERDAQRAA